MTIPIATPSTNDINLPITVIVQETNQENISWIQIPIPINIANSTRSSIYFIKPVWFIKYFALFNLFISILYIYFHILFSISLFISFVGLKAIQTEKRLLFKIWFNFLIVEGITRWFILFFIHIFNLRVIFFFLTFLGVACDTFISISIFPEIFGKLRTDNIERINIMANNN